MQTDTHSCTWNGDFTKSAKWNAIQPAALARRVWNNLALENWKNWDNIGAYIWADPPHSVSCASKVLELLARARELANKRAMGIGINSALYN